MNTNPSVDAGAATSSYPIRRRLQTRDPKRAHDFLRLVYGEHEAKVGEDGADFNFHADVADGERFSIGRVDYSAMLDIDVAPSEFVTVNHLLGGRYRYSSGRREQDVAVGELLLSPPGVPHAVRSADIRLGVVRLEMSAVKEYATSMTGVAPASLRFDFGAPISPSLGRYWQATVQHVAQGVFPNQKMMANPLIRAQTLWTFSAAALCCFSNNSRDAVTNEDTNVAPAAVRRAVDYIERNFTSPISLSDIAEAARIGPRSLQLAFRRHLDTTPSAYIRLLRLQGAHRELSAADPTLGDTVADIANRWGFGHHGRFAHSYQEIYGRSPRDTLHR